MSKVGEAKNLIVQTSDGNIVRVGCCRSSKSPVKNNVTQKTNRIDGIGNRKSASI